jgi:hypothetical protein
MTALTYPGPTGNLKPRQRRSGRGGTAWLNGGMRGEITAVEWDVEVEQVGVPMPGRWSDGSKPGGEARRATIRFQDVDDYWRRRVWKFLQARKRGDRVAAAQVPTFDLITQIDDVGAPAKTRWALRGCELYGYSGGFATEEALLNRDLAMTFEDDEPLDSFEYVTGGVAIYRS